MEEKKEEQVMPDPNEIHVNIKRRDTEEELFDSD